jgi:hypothetical protein
MDNVKVRNTIEQLKRLTHDEKEYMFEKLVDDDPDLAEDLSSGIELMFQDRFTDPATIK